MTTTDTHDPDTEAGQADADQAQAVERLLDAGGEANARELLTATGNRAGLQHLDRILARRRAAELLEQGQPQPAVREQLMSERGLSRRTAYRVIEAAAALLGLRTGTTSRASASAPSTTTDPQPESPTMTTTEATHDTTAEAVETDTSTASTPPAEAVDTREPQSQTDDLVVAVRSVGPPVAIGGRVAISAPEAPGPRPLASPPAAATPVRVRITHLRAPWPAGAGVGHVVEFVAGEVPAWAAGKCVTVDLATPADFVQEPPRPAAPPLMPAPASWAAAPAAGETLADAQAQLAEVRTKIAAAAEVLGPALARRAAAAREVERLDSARSASTSFGAGELADVPDIMTWRQRRNEAGIEQSKADAKAASAQRTMDALQAQELRLVRIVTAAERLPAALQAQADAVEQVQAAQADVERMEGAIRRIDAELRNEEAAQAELKRTAAAELLERARTGQSLDDVATPNEGRANALREARAGAVEELAAAKRRANEQRGHLAKAVRATAAVEADRLVADFEQAYRRAVETAAAWALAHYRAAGQLPAFPHLHVDAGKAFEAALEADTNGSALMHLTQALS